MGIRLTFAERDGLQDCFDSSWTAMYVELKDVFASDCFRSREVNR